MLDQLELDALRASKWVLVVHFHGAPDVIRSIVEMTGSERPWP
jgi:hypothetical protein